MKYARILKKYFDDLAAKSPVPGGGGAAACAAGMGAALLSMVANFTVGKPRYARHEGRVKEILERSEGLRLEFMELIDRDAEAFLSRDPRKAMEVPLAVCRLCHEAAGLCLPLAKKGNVNLVSDAAVAAAMFESACSAAYFNVIINLALMKDPRLSTRLKKELSAKISAVRRMRAVTEEYVSEVIAG